MKIVSGILMCGCLFFMAVPARASDGQKIEIPQDRTIASPTGYLMREHGELLRIILIYQELIRRIDENIPFSADCLADSTSIVHSFFQNYHEKLEEEFIFTRLERGGKLGDLVKVLREQHIIGGRLIDYIIANSDEKALHNDATRSRIRAHLRLFVDMYLPHMAREDTEIFPAFRTVTSQDELNTLGALFDQTERDQFGENNLEKINVVIAHIEHMLGIDDMTRFTRAMPQ